MSHLIHLKRRIKSIKTTEKITHAMRLIAMSLYSKLDKQYKPLQYHVEKLEELFKDLRKQNPNWKNATFLPEDPFNQNPLYIVISATKGFCGGLNNNMFKYIDYKLHIEEHQSPTFITIGKKATSFVDTKFNNIMTSYNDLNSNNFADIAGKLAHLIIEAPSTYSSVIVYSSVFKNFFNQKPVAHEILPLGDSKGEEAQQQEVSETSEAIEPIWEQSKIDTINFVAKKYLDARLIDVLFQALISEYASRFVAMDNATTNAESYLETLTLQFNKLRQALITREVSELSASL